MANQQANKKLHGFSKSERLCNFTLKKLLFNHGESFQQYPFKIFWKTLDCNLEKIFFSRSLTEYAVSADDLTGNVQNPSFPQKTIPRNALFSHPAQSLVGVSTKAHKSAAMRNHLKRLVRESYRQNKAPFYSFLTNSNKLCLVGIIYTAGQSMEYQDIESKIIVSLQKIQNKITEQQTR